MQTLAPLAPARPGPAAESTVRDRLRFGTSYARTLRLWREKFTGRASEVDALGFDHVFRRMWTFYLAYCEAGFRAGYLGVSQFGLARHPFPGGQ